MRYTPNPNAVVKEMLTSVGLFTLDELFSDVPNVIKEKCVLPESYGMSELSVRRQLDELAFLNETSDDCAIFLGAGCYDHYIPAAVSQLIARSEFYTAYTPYQPEISQGILQSIFEYQTLICNLTGMDIANASLYCGGSALAQACQVAAEVTKKRIILLPKTLHPDYAQIVKTYSISDQMEIRFIPEKKGQIDLESLPAYLNNEVAGVVIQYPNFYGNLEAVADIIQMVREKTGALVIMSVDPIVLSMLKSPGEWGADIAVGDAQVLGNSMSFGGPHLGFMAVTNKLLRKIPGRLVGQTVDENGKRSFVLTLQAREQHIRREKANSNICSNQALNALTVLMYLTFVGPFGLKQAALSSHRMAQYAHSLFAEAGFTFPHNVPFFREFVVNVPNPHFVNEKLLEFGIIGGYELEKGLLFAFTEKRTRDEIDELVELMTKFSQEISSMNKEQLNNELKGENE